MGGKEGVRNRESYNSQSGRKKKKKNWTERQRHEENISLVKRKDRQREMQRQTKMALGELISSPPPSTQLNWWHGSEWVYGLVDYQLVWHRPYLAQAWSIPRQAVGWEGSQSRRASSELCLAARAVGPQLRPKHFSHSPLNLSPGPSCSAMCSFKSGPRHKKWPASAGAQREKGAVKYLISL